VYENMSTLGLFWESCERHKRSSWAK